MTTVAQAANGGNTTPTTMQATPAQIWVAIAENGADPPEVIAASLRRDALLMDNLEYRRRFENWTATTRASEPYAADVQVVPLID